MKILFLDDNKDRHSVFKRNSIGCYVDHVYTAKEAIEKLNDEDVFYDTIFLDHDLNWETENQLNDNEEDGRTVAKHLATVSRYQSSLIIIHSLNNAGGLLMKGILEDHGFGSVFYIPFAWERWNKDDNGNWMISVI